MTLTLDSPEINYDEIMEKIRQFGREAILDKHYTDRLMLCIEELVIQNIHDYPIRVHAEYSEADEIIDLCINWGGRPFDPLTEGNQMSAAIIRHLTSDLQYSYKDENRLRIKLSP